MAAIFHEICHLAMLFFFGGTIESVGIGAGGTEIVATLNGKQRELIAILGGPAGSFLLLGFRHIFPKLAICACIQGAFNLLPILPLDGGRIVQCVFLYYWPEKTLYLQQLMKAISAAVLLIVGVIGTVVLKLGCWPILGGVFLFLKVVLRKIPCKDSQFRVQ